MTMEEMKAKITSMISEKEKSLEAKKSILAYCISNGIDASMDEYGRLVAELATLRKINDMMEGE